MFCRYSAFNSRKNALTFFVGAFYFIYKRGYPAVTPQKTAVLQKAYIFPPPQAGERYGALNYPFVYSIFSWYAKGIVIIHNY